ncbi:hypothetical protein Cgig2_028753 [Carnegiea gigantea]|uniref:Uncharacterized protein n=1 Tax=Carnegiea gigantea TaxID=171969 RepID=A0A9Q1GM35_9CARY|nr:hypothetical protein Cgig2_028753 [Carnegiea gigantea]
MEHLVDCCVKTATGLVSVATYGDPDKPALMNLVLKDCSRVQKHYLCFSTAPAYNILALLGTRFVPGLLNLLGAALISCDRPSTSVDDLAGQILEVMSNLLHFYMMCGVVKETLVKQYFSKDQYESANVMQFFEPINSYYMDSIRLGLVSAAIYGDPDKPALVTYPDLALNCKIAHVSRGIISASLQLLHITYQPSWAQELFQLAAAPICYDGPSPFVDNLADQILEVLNYSK